MDLEDVIRQKKVVIENKRYDYIIYGDCLEHVTKPDMLLKTFECYLEQDGFIIASIPNIANWMIRFKLFFGNFNSDGGILHEQHLRFFTIKTATQLLVGSGYEIVSIKNHNMTKVFKVLGRIYPHFLHSSLFFCAKK